MILWGVITANLMERPVSYSYYTLIALIILFLLPITLFNIRPLPISQSLLFTTLTLTICLLVYISCLILEYSPKTRFEPFFYKNGTYPYVAAAYYCSFLALCLYWLQKHAYNFIVHLLCLFSLVFLGSMIAYVTEIHLNATHHPIYHSVGKLWIFGAVYFSIVSLVLNQIAAKKSNHELKR